jgi:uncharacterized membrane protein
MEPFDRYDVSPEQAWLTAFFGGIVTVGVAALLFTERVYYGFLWRYLWGPVQADANDESCFVYLQDGGSVVPGSEAPGGCAPAEGAFVAEPGYTVVSTAVYIVVLVFMLAGVYLLLERFDLSPYDKFFYALFPFMLFGGVLRTVEDAFVAAQRAGQTPAIEFPASAVLISPFIYFTVFVIALGSFLLSKYLARSGRTETFYYPLAAMGAGWLAGAFGYLLYLSAVNDWITLHPTVLAVVLGLATVTSGAVYFGADRFRPAVHAGTGLMGLVVLWAHAVDGVANVVAQDWAERVWGLGEYSAKHPFNRLIIDTTSALQGGDTVAGVYVGEGWPFLLVKLAVPLLLVSVFDKEFIEESPRYAVMLLGAIVAVGLGPGTRDMIRLAFGI